jgi:WD40 repeat protein
VPHNPNNGKGGICPLNTAKVENPDDTISRFQDLIEHIAGNRPSFENSQAAAKMFCHLLKRRKSLIVIDDLWEKDKYLWDYISDVRDCAWLVTTQDYDTIAREIPADKIVKIEAMERDEPIKLLVMDVKGGVETAKGELDELAGRLYGWPLLLKHANLYVGGRVGPKYSLQRAIESLNNSLNEIGLVALDDKKIITAAIENNVERLDDVYRSRYFELAVFPEGVGVPQEVIEKLWTATGGLRAVEVEPLCLRLFKVALLYGFPDEIQLYGLFYQYITKHLADRLSSLHKQLLDAHPFCHKWAEMPETEDYLWKHLAFHLVGADRRAVLANTVKDSRYLVTKIKKYGPIPVKRDLLEATNAVPTDEPLRKLQQCFANINHLFDRHSMNDRDINVTLFARMQHLRNDLRPTLKGLAQKLEFPIITFLSDLPALSALPFPVLPGTSEDHREDNRQDYVISYDVDRKWFLSASSDHILKIVDAETGDVLQTFEGHSETVNDCAVNRDGSHIVSASSDYTLKIWDIDSGENVPHTLIGHMASVNGCAYSHDGSLIVSASSDGTLIIWDALEGKKKHVLERRAIKGELLAVTKASMYPRLQKLGIPVAPSVRLSWLNRIKSEGFSSFLDDDGKPKIGELEVMVDGHSKAVNDCAFSSDGKLIVSAADDGTLKLWDAKSGMLQKTLRDAGHSGFVKSCAFSRDGTKIISASSDCTLIIWDARECKMLRKLERRWNENSAVVVEGHTGEVNDCTFSSDGNLIVSASDDCTIKVWDAEHGQCLTTFYNDEGMNSCVIDDDMIIAGSERGVYFLKLVRQIEEDGSSVATVQSDEKTDEADPENSAESARPRESQGVPQNLEALSVRESEMPPPTEPQLLQRQSMVYASTFLSHSSADRELVHAVARELGQRGILAWLDVNELRAGLSLSSALAEAVQRQATVTVFLSLAAVKSDWVDRELRVAFEMEKELGITGRILPVFLDDHEIVVQAHPLLRERWLDGSGRYVNILGIVPSEKDDDASRAKEIAGKIASSIYRALELEKKNEVVIYLDQRGEGSRRGEPKMPPALQNTDAPVLVFRPDLGKRSWSETLIGSAWEEFRDNIKDSLSEALGTLRVGKRKIYLAGLAQLGLAYLIGKHFARNTETELHCVGRNEVFTSTNQPGASALSGGNPHCETSHAKIPPLPEQGDLGAISLLLCKVKENDERFIDDPLRHIKATPDAPPTILVKHDDPLTNSVQVMIYIANVVSLLQRLRSERDVRAVNLYTSLPFHAVPLLASNLHPYVVDSVRFMEYRSDLREQSPTAAETYSRLSF